MTPDLVLSALRQVELPGLEVQVQPEDKTLVNFDTIFFTESHPVKRTLRLLGQSVEVEATPASYRFVFGDGEALTSEVPGEPYPAKTITHRYLDAHVTVHPRVDTTYSARFRVNGGAWQDIDGTVTTIGPATDLRIAEATALLSGNHR